MLIDFFAQEAKDDPVDSDVSIWTLTQSKC